MGDKKNLTILDLAKHSGISKSTISRYLQNPDTVSLEKRMKIEKTINELGFVRNSFASLMRTSKTNLIGVVIPDLDNPFFLKILKRLDELSQALGKSLITKTSQSSAEKEIESLNFIKSFSVEAVFLCRSELDEKTLDSLTFNIPVVSIDKKFDSYPSIVSNNFENGVIMTRHLFQQEPGNVMFFSRNHESHSVIERINGYKHVCEQENRPVYEYKYNFREDLDYHDLIDYIKSNDIRAIISRNDNDAVKVLFYLNHLKLHGGIHSIKVSGFDNIKLAERISPRLTTIDQQIELICDRAFNMVYRNQDSGENKSFIQPGELIVRESTLNGV